MRAKIIDYISGENQNTDLALLQVDEPIPHHPYILLSEQYSIGDKLYSFGYSEAYPNGEPITPELEGFSPGPPTLKLKQAQIVPGFSGAPLLNIRTGGICGIIRRSRDRRFDLGGRAVPSEVVLITFRELQRLHSKHASSNAVWVGMLTPPQRKLLGLAEDLTDFRSRVLAAYQLLNYTISRDVRYGQHAVDAVIRRRIADYTIARAIFINPAPTIDDVEPIPTAFALAKHADNELKGSLICRAHPGELVARHLASSEINIVTLDELESQILDSHKICSAVIRDAESNPRYELSRYVPPKLIPGENNAALSADLVIEEWINDPFWNQLTVLGDAGTGKTFLTRALSYQLATNHINDPANTRFPIRVDLRHADRELNLESLILTHLSHMGCSDVSFNVFMHALRQGKIILIFDGFDEMATRVTPEVTSHNFHELSRAVVGDSKVLLTCRTHYFRSRNEEHEIILGAGDETPAAKYESEAAQELYWDLLSRRGFRIAYMETFGPDEIESYVRTTCGSDADDALARIREIYNLFELCQTPLLLDMIVRSLDRLGEGSVGVSPATLYEIYTAIWISRDRWRKVLRPRDKDDILQILACRLFQDGVVSLHYTVLFEHLQHSLSSAVDNPRRINEIDNEIRTASFLVRDDRGHYGFAHTSFREFFFAKYIFARFQKRDFINALSTAPVTPEVVTFFVDMARSLLDEIDAFLSRLLTDKYHEGASENGLAILYHIRRSGAKKSLICQTGCCSARRAWRGSIWSEQRSDMRTCVGRICELHDLPTAICRSQI